MFAWGLESILSGLLGLPIGDVIFTELLKKAGNVTVVSPPLFERSPCSLMARLVLVLSFMDPIPPPTALQTF